jgi:hypothetical protein
MNLVVQRTTFTDQSTCGEMLINGAHQCWTLEPRSDQSQGKPYCIPAGTYNISLIESARFAMITPHVLDVPGFTEIEVHPGNYPSDTEGCTLVGESQGPDMVGSSRMAFNALMQRLQGQTDISITYIGGPTQ